MCLSFIMLPENVPSTIREFLVYVHGVIVGKTRPRTFEVSTDHFTNLSYVVNHRKCMIGTLARTHKSQMRT